jgi:hypothetical protein
MVRRIIRRLGVRVPSRAFPCRMTAFFCRDRIRVVPLHGRANTKYGAGGRIAAFRTRFDMICTGG